ncbi:MAG: hypothetical protein J6S89_10025 [Paludibacteraceae bacterium]|nr:hypothetical protein [Paludibacteraceae bacterium]
MSKAGEKVAFDKYAKIAQLVEHNLAPRNKKGKTNLGKGDRDTGSESEIDRMRK